MRRSKMWRVVWRENVRIQISNVGSVGHPRPVCDLAGDCKHHWNSPSQTGAMTRTQIEQTKTGSSR